MYTYLLINVFTILFPLVRSFENKVNFYSKWHFAFGAIAVTSVFFVVWDHLFTIWGVWSFNEKYVTGLFLFSLPIEEWFFFITVPFACLFIYEVLHYFFPSDPLKKYSTILTIVFLVVLIAVAILNTDKIYTLVSFSFAALFLAAHWLVYKTRYLGMFYFTYLVHLIPFTIVNGILTYLPIVQYNNNENLNIRIFSIPVEDSIYSFLLLLMNITIYEFFKLKLHKNIKY